jgi:hypothetical protein
MTFRPFSGVFYYIEFFQLVATPIATSTASTASSQTHERPLPDFTFRSSDIKFLSLIAPQAVVFSGLAGTVPGLPAIWFASPQDMHVEP